MPFHEKSAWIMAFLLALLGAAYFYNVIEIWSGTGQLVAPMLPLVVVYTISLVVLAAGGHAVIAVLAPKEANAATDERERLIFDRAGHYSSYVIGAGIVLSLGLYLLLHNGDLLFYMVFASLMMGQIMEYVFQITFYRTSV
ncbi:MAG: hypothetical protein ACR2QZ_15000 [Woeseiaceae bacterium]